jgi:hypothetical protein
VDLAIRRTINLTRQVRTQLRFEVFNVLNHPNFAPLESTLTSSTFGVSRQMLNSRSAGVGEQLNSLYQWGGPRSCELVVKFLF